MLASPGGILKLPWQYPMKFCILLRHALAIIAQEQFSIKAEYLHQIVQQNKSEVSVNKN